MKFQWDETKRKKVIKDRKVDFVYAASIFENEVLTRIDNRQDYGEVREISLGMVDKECFVVVHTAVGDETRLITAWKGGKEERERYKEGIALRHKEDEGKG